MVFVVKETNTFLSKYYDLKNRRVDKLENDDSFGTSTTIKLIIFKFQSVGSIKIVAGQEVRSLRWEEL